MVVPSEQEKYNSFSLSAIMIGISFFFPVIPRDRLAFQERTGCSSRPRRAHCRCSRGLHGLAGVLSTYDLGSFPVAVRATSICVSASATGLGTEEV